MELTELKQRARNPRFNLGRDAATGTAPPPFSFSGVVMRFFPLKADFLTLARFCDEYLNLAPEFAYFRPSMPFVLLSVVNYGRMSMEAGNLGWTSQNEVLFSIPLEWYTVENGEYVFKDHAQVAPFIFVDDEASQVGGREVYGWPKVQGWFASDVDPWAVDPRSPRSLLRLRTRVFEKLYAGQPPERREILAIQEDPPASFSSLPPDPRNPLNPLVSIPRALTAWSDLLRAGLDMWTTLPVRGYDAIDRRTTSNMLASVLGSTDLFSRKLQANTINLKQFRDAADPTQACYQALTNAKMEITQVRRGGMLGDASLLQGDPSGGHRILLSRYESMPILETLGLEVSEQTQGEGPPVATLMPVLPFWQEVDLRYEAGENLCWRSKEQGWRDATRQSSITAEVDAPEPTRHAYNTISSSGVQVATGPFRFPKATLRIVPLEADPEKLQKICDECLNEGLKKNPTAPGDAFADPARSRVGKFTAVGSKVYLAVTSFGEMTSESNNIGPWADKRVDFAIPVKLEGQKETFEFDYVLEHKITFHFWTQAKAKEKELGERLGSLPQYAPERASLEQELADTVESRASLEREVREQQARMAKGELVFEAGEMDGVFSPFMFAAGGIANSTGREVNGWNTIEAEIASPKSLWLQDAFTPPRPLLDLKAQVFPALGVGQKSDLRTVLEVLEAERGDGAPEEMNKEGDLQLIRMAVGDHRDTLAQIEDSSREEDEELARTLKMLGGAILNQFSLKQFRDAAEPTQACYQAIVRCPMSIEKLDKLKLIGERIHVKIHRYPDHPIVDTLGLAVESYEGAVACLEPAIGYYVEADLRAELAENLCWRAGSIEWNGPARTSGESD